MNQTELPNRAAEYCNKWQLTHPRLVADTKTSLVYKTITSTGQHTALKLLKPLGQKLEKDGFRLLASYRGKDAVSVVRFDHHAALMNWLPGPSLHQLFENGEDEKAVEVQISLTSRLLAQTGQPTDMTNFRSILAKPLQRAPEDIPEFAKTAFITGREIVTRRLEAPLELAPIHGDLHPRNIFWSGDGWQAIDPRGLMAPPAFEFADLFFSPWDQPDVIFRPRRMENSQPN